MPELRFLGNSSDLSTPWDIKFSRQSSRGKAFHWCVKINLFLTCSINLFLHPYFTIMTTFVQFRKTMASWREIDYLRNADWLIIRLFEKNAREKCTTLHRTDGTIRTKTESYKQVSLKYSLRHRKCGVRGYMHELFVSKTRTSEVRANEGFWQKQRVHVTPYKALSMTWAVYYT